MYVGRQQLDAATLDRFAVLDFDYDENVERELAVSEDLYDFISEVRKSIVDNDIRYTVSMRATINATKLHEVMELETIMESVIFKGMEKSDLNMVARNMETLRSNEYYDELMSII